MDDTVAQPLWFSMRRLRALSSRGLLRWSRRPGLRDPDAGYRQEWYRRPLNLHGKVDKRMRQGEDAHAGADRRVDGVPPAAERTLDAADENPPEDQPQHQPDRNPQRHQRLQPVVMGIFPSTARRHAGIAKCG